MREVLILVMYFRRKDIRGFDLRHCTLDGRIHEVLISGFIPHMEGYTRYWSQILYHIWKDTRGFDLRLYTTYGRIHEISLSDIVPQMEGYTRFWSRVLYRIWKNTRSFDLYRGIKRDQNLVNRCYAKTTKDRYENQNNTTKCQFPFKKEGRKRDCSSLIDLKYAKISVNKIYFTELINKEKFGTDISKMPTQRSRPRI